MNRIQNKKKYIDLEEILVSEKSAFIENFRFDIHGLYFKYKDKQSEEIKEKNEKTYQKVNKIIDDPARFINTVQAVSVLITLVTGICIGFKTDKALLRIGMAVLWVIVLLVFGIIIPKKLGARHSKGISLKLTNITYMMTVVLMPVTFCVSVIADMILKIFGIDPNEPEENVTEEDIISVINEGHVQGVLLASEAKMISNIVEFGDKEAKDIMTHRTAMVCVDGEMLLCDAAEYILGLNNSRFPVYIENIDNIIGIVNMKDLLMYDDFSHFDMQKILRKPKFTYENKKVSELLIEMKQSTFNLAIVMDEYGEFSGIVTLEDIIEEIVGDVQDEYDAHEEENIVKLNNQTYDVKGYLSLHDLNDYLDLDLDSEDFDSVGGLVIDALGRLPQTNDETTLPNGIRIKVLKVEKNRIESVRLILPDTLTQKDV